MKRVTAMSNTQAASEARSELFSHLDAPLLIRALSYQLMLLRSGGNLVEDGQAVVRRLEAQIDALRDSLPNVMNLFPATSWAAIASALEQPEAIWAVHTEEDILRKGGMYRVFLSVDGQMWNTELAFEPEVAAVYARNLEAHLRDVVTSRALPMRRPEPALELSDEFR